MCIRDRGYGGIGFGTSPNVSSDDVYRTGDAFMGRLHYVYAVSYTHLDVYKRHVYHCFAQISDAVVHQDFLLFLFAFCVPFIGGETDFFTASGIQSLEMCIRDRIYRML